MIVALALVLTAAAAGPPLTVGQPLPELRGEFLSGRTAVLPQAAAGKVTLLLLGFSYDSRYAVEAWGKRFRGQFGADSRVTFYEIPMIGGLARMGKWFIDSGMRKGTPKEDYEHVITVYGGAGPWKHWVGHTDPTAAYLILLDGTGRVVWTAASVGVDTETYGALSAEVGRLLSGY